jgi:hypothetical protein
MLLIGLTFSSSEGVQHLQHLGELATELALRFAPTQPQPIVNGHPRASFLPSRNDDTDHK